MSMIFEPRVVRSLTWDAHPHGWAESKNISTVNKVQCFYFRICLCWTCWIRSLLHHSRGVTIHILHVYAFLYIVFVRTCGFFDEEHDEHVARDIMFLGKLAANSPRYLAPFLPQLLPQCLALSWEVQRPHWGVLCIPVGTWKISPMIKPPRLNFSVGYRSTINHT